MKYVYEAKMFDCEGFQCFYDADSEDAAEAYAKDHGYELLRVKRIPVVECCDEDIQCDRFTNTCGQCGADYNFAGQRLASRSQWGEETGEHWSECY